MDYFPILPPFEFKSFDKMSKKEAKNYFDWFMETKSAKLEQLKKLVDDTGYESCRLDYSDESLVYVWRWYLDNIELLDRPEEEIREEVERETAGLNRIAISKGGVMTELNKKQMYDYFYNEKPSKKISTLWQFVAMDIGIYLGECLIHKHPDKGLYWGYVTKPRNYIDVNRPLLMGLKKSGLAYPSISVEAGIISNINIDTLGIVEGRANDIVRKSVWNEQALLDSFRNLETGIYLPYSQQNLAEISEMSEKEIETYFEWFVSQIRTHIRDIGMCSKTDFSEESLTSVWTEYLDRVEQVEKEEHIKIERLKQNKKARKPIVKMEVNRVEVYVGCLTLALRISTYLAELFRRKHEGQGIHWGYITEPKSLPYVNRPLLRGFKPETKNGPEVVMDQIGIFSDLAVRAAAGERDKDALMHLYREWDAKV